MKYGDLSFTVTIKQSPKPELRLTSGSTITIDPNGGSQSITYTLTNRKNAADRPEVKIDKANWLTADNSIDGKITITAQSNSTGRDRSDTVTVKYGDLSFTITVKQSPMPVNKPKQEVAIPNNEIWYTTIDGGRMDPNRGNFGAKIKSNRYENGKGIITFEKDVTEIGWCAFLDCYRLASITIPNSVTQILQDAFNGCTNLKSITIPDSVTGMGYCVFNDCKSLREFKGRFATKDGHCLIIGNTLMAFAPACGVKQYAIPYGVTNIAKYAFYKCNNLESVTIPDSVTKIESSAFKDCSNLANINIPDDVRIIDMSTFQGCSSLATITIPSNVKEIGPSAFEGCSRLAGIIIPYSVSEIGYDAFKDCMSLQSITIPYTVTTIGFDAFENCRNLKWVYSEAATPPNLSHGAFLDSNYKPLNCTIYVPIASEKAYKKADGWKSYAKQIVGSDF